MSDIITHIPEVMGAEQCAQLDRANEVRNRLNTLKTAIESNFLDICELLLEVHKSQHYTIYGYGSFTAWIEEASGLDISGRQALYYVQIAKKAAELGLSRADLLAARVSKLKEIFLLDAATHSEDIKQLVASAKDLSLDEVREAVRKLREDAGQSTMVRMLFKVEPEVKETVEQAFELARRNYGSTVVEGEVAEISDSKCLELISVSFLQDPNNQGEQ